jgi:hypothetical protein
LASDAFTKKAPVLRSGRKLNATDVRGALTDLLIPGDGPGFIPASATNCSTATSYAPIREAALMIEPWRRH